MIRLYFINTRYFSDMFIITEVSDEDYELEKCLDIIVPYAKLFILLQRCGISSLSFSLLSQIM